MKYSAMKHITLIVLFALSYGGVAAQDNISKTSNVLLPEMRADCTFLHVLDSVLVVEHTEKYYKNIAEYGNTSAASIPLVLSELEEAGTVGPGSRVLVVGFGGGLTWGGALVEFA